MLGFLYKSQEIILDNINVFLLRCVCINSKVYDTIQYISSVLVWYGILYKMKLWVIYYRAAVGGAVLYLELLFCFNIC